MLVPELPMKELNKYHALFKALAQLGEPIWDTDIPTACLAYNNHTFEWRFNPRFYQKLSQPELAFVIAHEALHLIMNHWGRIKSLVVGGHAKAGLNDLPRQTYELLNKKANHLGICADVVVNETLKRRYGFSHFRTDPNMAYLADGAVDAESFAEINTGLDALRSHLPRVDEQNVDLFSVTTRQTVNTKKRDLEDSEIVDRLRCMSLEELYSLYVDVKGVYNRQLKGEENDDDQKSKGDSSGESAAMGSGSGSGSSESASSGNQQTHKSPTQSKQPQLQGGERSVQADQSKQPTGSPQKSKENSGKNASQAEDQGVLEEEGEGQPDASDPTQETKQPLEDDQEPELEDQEGDDQEGDGQEGDDQEGDGQGDGQEWDDQEWDDQEWDDQEPELDDQEPELDDQEPELDDQEGQQENDALKALLEHDEDYSGMLQDIKQELQGLNDLSSTQLQKVLVEIGSLAKQAGTSVGPTYLIVVPRQPPKKKWETVIKRWALSVMERGEFNDNNWFGDKRSFQWMHLAGDEETSALMLPGEGTQTSNKHRIPVSLFLDTSDSCLHHAEKIVKAALSFPPNRFEIKVYGFHVQVYPIDLTRGRNVYAQLQRGGTRFQSIEDFLQLQVQQTAKPYPKGVFVITDGYGGNPVIQHNNRWVWMIIPEQDPETRDKSKVDKIITDRLPNKVARLRSTLNLSSRSRSQRVASNECFPDNIQKLILKGAKAYDLSLFQ